MTTHEPFDEVVSAYALDALERDERVAFEAHLATCERCREMLADVRRVSAAIGLSTEPVAPPPDLKARTLARALGQEAAGLSGRVAVKSHSARVRTASPRRRAPVWMGLALAASVVMAMGLGLYALQLRRALDESAVALQDATRYINQLSSDLEATRRDANVLVDTLSVLRAGDMVLVNLQGQGLAPGATGRAFVSRARGVLFHAERLPPVASGRTYQLWVLPAGAGPVSAGTFRVDAGGMSTLAAGPSTAFSRVRAVAVTDEPDGGSPGPTTTPLLVGSVAN